MMPPNKIYALCICIILAWSISAFACNKHTVKDTYDNMAPNFNFETRNGDYMQLYDLDTPTLLIFYDPDCNHCREILEPLENDLLLYKGYLNILAVYTEGNEKLWRKTCKTMPNWWTVAIDRSNIVKNDIYDVYAMPMMILIGKDYQMELFDPTPDILLQYLQLMHIVK